MKHLRLAIPDELHAQLKSMCTHHGHLSHLIRRGIRLVIDEQREAHKSRERLTLALERARKAKDLAKNTHISKA